MSPDLTLENFFFSKKMQSRWSLLKKLSIESIGIIIIELLSKERGQKKNGIMWEKIPKGGRGLTQTHSIFFSVFSNSGAYKMAKKYLKTNGKKCENSQTGGRGEGVRHLGIFLT